MVAFITGCLVVFSVIIQSTILNRVSLLGARPDLVLMLTILLALLRGSRLGAGIGFGAGLLQDILSGQFIGANALTKMATGYLIGLAEENFFKENPVIPMLTMAIGTLGNEILFWILLRMFGRPLPFLLTSIRLIIPTVILNSVLAPFLFSRLKKMNDFLMTLSR